ncbi:MAG TPA: sensor histidine kinase, partial [Gemmatimonadales bacterium]|nr:sensor histidine kinase [Gemmatimonadales bacterium]
GDAMLLREAVMELIENACRHSSGDGPVRIGVTARDRAAVISVENPGPALPADWEARAPGPHAGSGSEPRGLGLALLRWIAAVHGGRLSATHSGGRNTISLEIPLQPR